MDQEHDPFQRRFPTLHFVFVLTLLIAFFVGCALFSYLGLTQGHFGRIDLHTQPIGFLYRLAFALFGTVMFGYRLLSVLTTMVRRVANGGPFAPPYDPEVIRRNREASEKVRAMLKR
jgi:hypothetical protein